jgi:hypothetical protein
MIVLVFAVMVVLILAEDAEVAVLVVVMAIAMVDVKALVLSLAVIKDALEYARKDVRVTAAAHALKVVGVVEVIVALELALLQVRVMSLVIVAPTLNEDNK